MDISKIQTRAYFQNATNSQLGRINGVGYIRNGNILTNKPMRVLGSYALVYLLDGSGIYEDANKFRQEVVAGDLILIFPTLPHRYGPINDNHWTEIYLVFEGSVFELWEKNKLLNPTHPIHHLEPIDYWYQRFDSVLGAPRKTGYSPALLEVCNLQSVLAEALLGGRHSARFKDDIKWASKACALLESDYSQEISLPEVASQIGTTYESFRKHFTKLIKLSPGKYRTIRKIDKACELMIKRNLNDNEIATMLGFCDEFHFSRRFKQIKGMSPRQFKNNLPIT